MAVLRDLGWEHYSLYHLQFSILFFFKLNKDSQTGEYCQALNKSQH